MEIITKTTNNSFFIRFCSDSNKAMLLLNGEPKHNDKPISILQIKTLDSKWFIAEVVYI